jgi:hypothetical protein
MQNTWKRWLQYGGFIIIGIVIGLAFRYQANTSLINTDQLNATLIANNAALLANLAHSNDEFQAANKKIEEMNTAMQRQNDGIAQTKTLLMQLIEANRLDESIVQAFNDKGWQLTAPSKTEN